jgi:ABC-type dipeptide/oligopeptide/nickel transport system permease component
MIGISLVTFILVRMVPGDPVALPLVDEGWRVHRCSCRLVLTGPTVPR